MEPGKQRRRIAYVRKGVPAIEDELAFIENKCSKRARKIFTESEEIQIELWFDKHYHDRAQHGDESGKRTGIDTHLVEDLVLRSFKHLLFYGSVMKGFTFLNHPGISIGSVRIVLQEYREGTMLNVVIEAHFLDIRAYEITVKTAMATDEFRVADGQYVLELQEDRSVLKKNENGKIKEIFAI